jgi:hypothetical protein
VQVAVLKPGCLAGRRFRFPGLHRVLGRAIVADNAANALWGSTLFFQNVTSALKLEVHLHVHEFSVGRICGSSSLLQVGRTRMWAL